MIIVSIKSSDSANRLIAKLLNEAAESLNLPKPTIKLGNKFSTELIKTKDNITFITDDSQFASNSKKPHFCLGEVIKLKGNESHSIYLNISNISSFFNPTSRLHYIHICEKAVLLEYNLLPKFNFIYKPIYTLNELKVFVKWLKDSKDQWLIACDIETSNSLITCISYSLINLNSAKAKAPISFCVDLIEYAQGKRLNSETGVQLYADKLRLLRQLHSLSNVQWIFHNGTYDNSYLLKYQCPTHNYWWDTQYMFFSMHSLSRKALWHVGSSVNPMYKYWKEEIKGGEEDDTDVKESGMPHGIDGYKRYLRYCALDSFFTLTNLFYMIQLISFKYKWTPNNYSQIQRLNLIYMEMQFNSFPIDNEYLVEVIEAKSHKATRIRTLFEYIFSDSLPSFNLNSTQCKRKIFYDLLKATPVGGAMGTDADTLSQISKQHPLIEWFANKLKQYQENNKFVTDFSKLIGSKSIACKLNATGTITSRANAKATDFFKGRNLQNITPEIRESFVAPEGYLIADIDYSQADVYFVASSCDDKMLSVITDDRDTHAVHASQVFGVPYEEVLAHKKDKHSMRTLVKPISHGGNYFMTARTMYARLLTEIGSEGIQQMAERIGLKRPKTTTDFIKVCDIALTKYRTQYPGLVNWGFQLYNEQLKNKGLIKTAFNFSTLFPIQSDPMKVDSIQRQIAAYKGQGGTAGLMNRFLVNLYFWGYSKPFDGKEYPNEGKILTDAISNHWIIPVVQVHDSIVFFIHKEHIKLLDLVMEQMSKPVNYNNHTFSVPTECDVGLFWSKKLMSGYEKGKEFDFSKLHQLSERKAKAS